MKCPYKFPLRSRADIIAFLIGHKSYVPMNGWNGGYQLAWNIKVYDFDRSGKTGEHKTHSRFDSRWDAYLEKEDIFWMCCEDARRWYTDGEYCTWPGDDQGGYKFSVNGRSGGYLLLDDWPGPVPGRWKLAPMIFDSRYDFHDWLSELDFSDLRKLYRLVVQLDKDLSNPNAELSYQYNFQREMREEEWLMEEQSAADALSDARPDMYGPAFLEQPSHIVCSLTPLR